MTGYLIRADKTRRGGALVIDWDRPVLRPFDQDYEVSDVQERTTAARDLTNAGFESTPGSTARQQGTEIAWLYTNASDENVRPILGQILVTRVGRQGDAHAEIQRLEIAPGVSDSAAHNLLFMALVQASWHGTAKIYSDPDQPFLAPFEFTLSDDCSDHPSNLSRWPRFRPSLWPRFQASSTTPITARP